MEIITKNGKDYLKSSILKVDKTCIEYSKFFKDLEECVKYCKEKLGKKEDERIGYGEYGGNIQSALSRFSATYFSPSFMKSFETNPATALISCFSDNEADSPLTIGTTVHKIFEDYYKQPKEERNRKDLIDIANDNILEGQKPEEILKYINGYIDIKDYLDEKQELNDNKLDCFCEYKGRGEVFIPKFNVKLPLNISYVVDRIDVRDDGLYILDYKTGYQSAKSATFDGYLTSMILYKWVIEQEFGMNVKGGYLVTPHYDKKYIPLDYSLVNESKVVEAVMRFAENLKQSTDSKILKYTNDGYFTSDDLKRFKEVMNENNDTIDYDIEVYIGEHID